MTSAQALAWLKERTIGEINRLLDNGWSSDVVDGNSRDAVLLLRRAETVFGISYTAAKANIFDSTLRAMALAIAAGEMEIDCVAIETCEAPTATCTTRKYSHDCILKPLHGGPHRSSKHIWWWLSPNHSGGLQVLNDAEAAAANRAYRELAKDDP